MVHVIRLGLHRNSYDCQFLKLWIHLWTVSTEKLETVRLVQTEKGYLLNVNAENVVQNMSFGEFLFGIHTHANRSAIPTDVFSIINHYRG